MLWVAMEVRPLASDLAAVAFVQAGHLCQGLSAGSLSTLINRGEVWELGPGEAVVEEGNPRDDLFMVLDGAVQVQTSQPGRTVVLANLSRAMVFGEIAVLTGQPRTATVFATTDTRIIRFPGEAARAVAEENPKFGRRLAALMAGRKRDTASKLSE